MSREVWLQSLFLNPPRICGRNLKPFSLYHEFLLKNLKSPLICGGEYSSEDLLSAILICSLDFKECKQRLFYKPSSFRWGLWILRWKYRNLNTAKESFEQYLSEYSLVPEHWENVNEESKGYSAPWEMHLVHVLCKEYNCTLAEAWDMPLNLGRCLYDTWAESKGDESLISDHQYELIEQGKVA